MSETRRPLLIVEDDHSTRTGLAELVQNWGFQTDEAPDGEEALRIADVERDRGMSLPVGRGAERVRSCGRARKRESIGEPLGTCGGGREAASSISVVLSKDSIGCSNVLVNGRKHRSRK